MIQEVADEIFLFKFKCRRDFEYVEGNGPWNFNKHLLLLRPLERDDSITSDSLCEAKFWAHLYNLPVVRRTVEVVRVIGAKLEVVLQVEDERSWDKCIRFRVTISVDRPLQRGLFVIDGEGRRTWVYVRYERLPEFCYWCGFLGQTENDCSASDGEGEVTH